MISQGAGCKPCYFRAQMQFEVPRVMGTHVFWLGVYHLRSLNGRYRVGYTWGARVSRKSAAGTWGWVGQCRDGHLPPCWLLVGALGCMVAASCPHSTHCLLLCFCSSGRQAARLFSVPHVVQQETTLAYLENQVAAALTLQSSHEYRHWLLLYARYLVNEGEVPVGSSILLGPAQSLSLHKPKSL